MTVLTSCEDGRNNKKNTEKPTVNIAVMGNPKEFYPSYQDGIIAAVADVQKEYADTGYVFDVEFFNDESNYQKGMKMVDQLMYDDNFIAVIGSRNQEINRNMAHIVDKHEKIFVSPYYMYDSVCEDNYYDYVFSMCSSAKNTGILLRKVVEQSSAKKWAVCFASKEFEKDELVGFVNYHGDHTEIVDCVSIDVLNKDFDAVYNKWDLLGVEGVVFFVEEFEGFAVLKKLKAKNPNLICAGDISFDNSTFLQIDAENKAAMTNFMMVDAFCLEYDDENDNKKFEQIADSYMNEKGTKIDYWYLQGYHAVRMICDTAVKNKTTNPKVIAEALHDNGYDGIRQKFEFDMRGMQTIVPSYYNIFTADGTWKKYTVY